jgi:sulfatase modifying factor 1
VRLGFVVAQLLLFCIGLSEAASTTNDRQDMVLVPAGTYLPFVLRSNTKQSEKPEFPSKPVSVGSFYLDRNLVTNQKYLHFVETNLDWRKSKTPSLYADSHYLENWPSDLKLADPKDAQNPVVHISWFAAKAYCEALGKTLPTTDQWEYALSDQGRNKKQIKEQILAWYSKPNSHEISKVGSGKPNKFGLYDMVALVWEWTLDFNSFLAGEELRESSSKDSGLFCGGGGLGTLDASDYASFMRYSFRLSLKASYSTSNLGFRCALEKK